jgi:ATP-dependent Clp protease, protease subunit
MRIENRSPFQRKKPEIVNKADETTLYLYDEISFWGINAKDFIKDLDGIKSGTIHLRINSPGGSVFDGTTIFNALKQHKSKVIVHIDGLAASISSIIAMAGDEIQMAKNAFFMIHEPWSMVIGSSEDMRKEADLLDKVRGTIANTYMDKSGKDESEILAYMEAETWFTADEAMEAGFIDSIYDEKIEKSQIALFDLSAFSKVPETIQDGEDKDITERDLERILRDAGCSRKQAKAILADGFQPEQRDADPVEPVEEQRDAVVIPPPADPVRDLLIRAETVAPKRKIEKERQ